MCVRVCVHFIDAFSFYSLLDFKAHIIGSINWCISEVPVCIPAEELSYAIKLPMQNSTDALLLYMGLSKHPSSKLVNSVMDFLNLSASGPAAMLHSEDLSLSS